jgi:hypothetical protein
MNYFSDWNLSDYGSLASLIGLLASVLISLAGFLINNKIKDLKKKVLFNTRVDNLLNGLRKYLDNLNVFIRDFDNNENNIKLELSKCKSQIESIVPKLPDEEQKDFKELLKILRKISQWRFEESPKWFMNVISNRGDIYKREEDVWEVLYRLFGVVSKLDNLVKDKKTL